MSAESQTPAFPLDSFRDAATYLRRPFTPEAVKFKVQSTWPKDNPTGGLIVGYVDARLVVERLNLLLPHLWHDEYQGIDAKHMLCRLTVDGITRQDIGEGDGKGLYSDALKRAAVKFGIGVSIYAIPKMILEVKTGQLKQVTRGGKKTCEMTSDGEKVVRAIYAKWLDDKGTQAFGEPLDHGDVEDAQGDYEAEASATQEEPAATAQEPEDLPDHVTGEEAEKVDAENRALLDELVNTYGMNRPKAEALYDGYRTLEQKHALTVRLGKLIEERQAQA